MPCCRNQMVRAAWTTIWVAVVAQIMGTLIGIFVAPTMLSSNPLVRAPAWGYRWLFQGTPLLLQILAFFAVLPQLGVPSELIASGLLALGINEGARMAEIVRSGLISVDAGQRDASHSLGLNRAQTFFLVVLPQAVKVIIPPLGNNFNYMLKATSLLAAISFIELLRVLSRWLNSTTRPLEIYSAATIYYLLMTSAWDTAQRRVEAWCAPTRERPGQELWPRRIRQTGLDPGVRRFVSPCPCSAWRGRTIEPGRDPRPAQAVRNTHGTGQCPFPRTSRRSGGNYWPQRMRQDDPASLPERARRTGRRCHRDRWRNSWRPLGWSRWTGSDLNPGDEPPATGDRFRFSTISPVSPSDRARERSPGAKTGAWNDTEASKCARTRTALHNGAPRKRPTRTRIISVADSSSALPSHGRWQ